MTHPALHHHLLSSLHRLVGHCRRLPAAEQALALRTRERTPGVPVGRSKGARHREVHRLCLLVFGCALATASPPKEEAAEEGEAEDEGEHHQGDGEGGHLAWHLENRWKQMLIDQGVFTGCSSGLLVLVPVWSGNTMPSSAISRLRHTLLPSASLDHLCKLSVVRQVL